MDVKWLDDFLAVAECCSFTRAAQRRNTSQSGLSRRIQSLEHWLGATLVDRDAHPFRLTDAGSRFLPLATHLRSSLVAARQLCAAEPCETQVPVTLCIAEGLESGMLSMLLARLKGQGISTSVRVVVKGFEAARTALLEGQAELWLTPQHAQLPLMLDADVFEAVSVAHDRLSPVVGVTRTGSPAHTLPGTPSQPTPFIEHGLSNYFAQIAGMQMAAVKSRAHMQVAGSGDSLHSLLAMVRQGMGLVFLPESMVRDDLRRGELALADTRWSTPLDIQLVRSRHAAGRGGVAEAAHRIWQGLALRDQPTHRPPSRAGGLPHPADTAWRDCRVGLVPGAHAHAKSTLDRLRST